MDGTLGEAAIPQVICRKLGENGLLIGIDRDRDALRAAEERLKEFRCRKIFVHDNYSSVKRVIEECGVDHIDGGLLDLGVSSYQLDARERGFSYMQPAPLDMRMDAEDPFSAYDVVNGYDKKELTRIIKSYGEERWASRISDFIVKARKEHPIETTDQLVEIIKSAVPAAARREGPHPAKRTFQAIRIEVNDELGQLEKAVDSFIDVLAPKGRLCIITFHSLEDPDRQRKICIPSKSLYMSEKSSLCMRQKPGNTQNYRKAGSSVTGGTREQSAFTECEAAGGGKNIIIYCEKQEKMMGG